MCFETRSQLFQTKQKVMWLERMSLLQTKNRGISQSVFVAKASQSSPLGQSKDISRFVLVAEASRSLARTFRGLYSNRARIMLGEKTRITDPTAITVFVPC